MIAMMGPRGEARKKFSLCSVTKHVENPREVLAEAEIVTVYDGGAIKVAVRGIPCSQGNESNDINEMLCKRVAESSLFSIRAQLPKVQRLWWSQIR
jgi:hypothetical protein